MYPCICTTRRVDERIREVRKSLSELASQEEKEEESRWIMKKRKRSRSPLGRNVKPKEKEDRNPEEEGEKESPGKEGTASQEDQASMTNLRPLGRNVKSEEKEDRNPEEEGEKEPPGKEGTASQEDQASMINLRPQHQPFAHLDGAGAGDGHQPPHHQQQGDGGEAGEAINAKKRFQRMLVGRQPHQTCLQVLDDVVENNQSTSIRVKPNLSFLLNPKRPQVPANLKLNAEKKENLAKLRANLKPVQNANIVKLMKKAEEQNDDEAPKNAEPKPKYDALRTKPIEKTKPKPKPESPNPKTNPIMKLITQFTKPEVHQPPPPKQTPDPSKPKTPPPKPSNTQTYQEKPIQVPLKSKVKPTTPSSQPDNARQNPPNQKPTESHDPTQTQKHKPAPPVPKPIPKPEPTLLHIVPTYTNTKPVAKKPMKTIPDTHTPTPPPNLPTITPLPEKPIPKPEPKPRAELEGKSEGEDFRKRLEKWKNMEQQKGLETKKMEKKNENLEKNIEMKTANLDMKPATVKTTSRKRGRPPKTYNTVGQTSILSFLEKHDSMTEGDQHENSSKCGATTVVSKNTLMGTTTIEAKKFTGKYSNTTT